MGSFTSLYFCRPTKPPRITGAGLVAFLRSFTTTGALTDREYLPTFEIKFGDAIDQDENPSDWIEWSTDTTGTTASIHWDIAGSMPLEEIFTRMERESRVVYRANVQIGGVSADLGAHMHRPPSNGIDELALDGWFLQIGPIRVDSRWDDCEFDCGWIALSLGGNGSIYPSLPRGLVDRAMETGAVRSVTSLCRERWPVEVRPATPAAVDGRSLMRDQWCTDIYAPIDWFWTAK